MMPLLGRLHVAVGRLDQAEQDVFNVLADVARLGERGGVGYRERNVQRLCQGLRQKRLAHARGAQQQDVALVDLPRCLSA